MLIRVGLWGIVTPFFNRDAMPFELCCCPVLSSSFDDCMRHGQNFMGFHCPEVAVLPIWIYFWILQSNFSHWSSLSLELTSFCYSISAQLLASLLCRISAPILPNAHAQFPSPSVPALSAHARLATLCDKLATNVLGEAGRGLTVNRAPFCRLYRLLSPSHGWQ